MKFEKLPFYWRLAPTGTQSPVPKFLPFEYAFDESVQLLIQKKESETLRSLSAVYREDANIGYLQDTNHIAQPYGTDFFRFIEAALAKWGARVRRVLELGCGGCTILSQLKSRGYDVVGIDPSPLAAREGARRGLQVINEFFPASGFSSKVDFIFHNDVLEHVENPVDFLRAQRAQLAPGGMVVTAVPDCTEGVFNGDVSMTMHQHLNYFDLESLGNTFSAAGFNVVALERAAYGGSLYCCALKDGSDSAWVPLRGRLKFDKFLAAAASCSGAIASRISTSLLSKRRVGFYVPLRALPYLSLARSWEGFRFFDDTSDWHRKCFDGIEVEVENFEELRRAPVDILFIMSTTFGRRISDRVASIGISSMEITLLSEMLKATT